MNEVNSAVVNDNEDVIKVVVYAHNVFEQIHPFADGNGRVGRVLAKYLLMVNDLPPIIIYDEEKKHYYESLEKFDTKSEMDSMVEFFKYEMEKTWQKTLERNKK